MPSQVGGDLSKIETGVCSVTYKSVQCGHTEGGVTVTIKHLTRVRKVDEYGESPVGRIHIGDDVKVKTKFVEKTMQVIQTVYQLGGAISSSMWGIGQVPGTNLATALAGTLLLHPLYGDGVKDDITIYKAAVIDQGDVMLGTVNQDTAFDCTWEGLIDESQTTYLIGKYGSKNIVA
jgi:hypothetical protein